MAIRRVIKEYEARLTAVGAQSTTGKIEHKTYGDNVRALRLRIRDLGGVASDFPLRLFINDVPVGELERTRNKAALQLDSRQGITVPTIVAGDEAEIRSGELILTRGIFYED